MNKRIVLVFVLGLLLCNVHNVVATPTTSLSDTEIGMLYFITFFGYCVLLCFLVRYVLPALDFLKGSILFDKLFVSVLIGIFIAFIVVMAFIVVVGPQNFICNKEYIQIRELFVIMCVSSIFIMGLGDIILVPEKEKNKKTKQLNIKTKKVSFVLSVPSVIIAYLIWQFGIIEMVLLLFIIPIVIAYKWWRLKTYYKKENKKEV